VRISAFFAAWLAALVVVAPAHADLDAGNEAYARRDYAAAQKAYEAAAAAGNSEAATRLAIMHLRGDGVEKNDGKAADLLASAASNFGPAAYNLARLYMAGRGVPKDVAKATAYLKQAVDMGDMLSAQLLSTIYYDGHGSIAKNHEEAARYARIAADAGLHDAQHQLGVFYYRGDGVPQSVEEAYYWMYIAGQRGLTRARMTARSLTDELPPEVVQKIELRASQWQPVKPNTRPASKPVGR
jgi:TPR repeat protein